MYALYCAKKYKQILLIIKQWNQKNILSTALTIMIWEVKFPPQSSVRCEIGIMSQAPENPLRDTCNPSCCFSSRASACPHPFVGPAGQWDSSQRSENASSLVHSFKGTMLGTQNRLLTCSTGTHRGFGPPALWVGEPLAVPQVPSLSLKAAAD